MSTSAIFVDLSSQKRGGWSQIDITSTSDLQQLRSELALLVDARLAVLEPASVGGDEPAPSAKPTSTSETIPQPQALSRSDIRWIGLAASGGAVVLGIGLDQWAVVTNHKFKDSIQRSSSARSLRTRGKVLAGVSDTLIGIGLVGVAATLAWYYLVPDKTAPNKEPDFAPGTPRPRVMSWPFQGLEVDLLATP